MAKEKKAAPKAEPVRKANTKLSKEFKRMLALMVPEGQKNLNKSLFLDAERAFAINKKRKLKIEDNEE